MLEDVLRIQCGLTTGKPVLAGISGGPDSLCLLGVMHTAGYPVIVAHFNHKLRPEADKESVLVSEHAQKLGLDFISDCADVKTYANENSLSIEEAARTLRYRFLFTTARKLGAQAVAVGHTADDQAETVLMHFLRGAGLAGLKGMGYRTQLMVYDPDIPLVRPLLSLWRRDTEAFCREHDLHPQFDASNTDPTYLRNRLRYSLIPELEKYNPRFKETLVRTARALQADDSFLQDMLQTAWQRVVSGSGAGWVSFYQPAMICLSPALQWNLIRKAAELLRPESRDFGFDALERAASFISASRKKRIDFINGLYLFRESGKIYLAAYEANLPTGDWAMVQGIVDLRIGQSLNLGKGWELAAKILGKDVEIDQKPTDNWCVWLDAELTGTTLSVRPPHTGDVFSPLGMENNKVKLREFFINNKLPKRARGHWPLVCAGNQIIWVPGFRISHPVRVTEKTKRVLQLSLKRK